jgi:hypothetical protein
MDPCLSGSVPIREICGSNLKKQRKRTTKDTEDTKERPFGSTDRQKTAQGPAKSPANEYETEYETNH